MRNINTECFFWELQENSSENIPSEVSFKFQSFSQ